MSDTHDLTIYNDGDNIISFEEFKEYIQEGNIDEQNFLDKASNAYDNIPQLIKTFGKLIDKSGVVGVVDEVLTGHNAQREQERLYYAVYNLGVKTMQSEATVRQAINDLKEEFPELTMLYFDKCKESRELKKTKVFRDIWFNSIISNSSTFTEKEYVFELVSTLSCDQINVLKYIYQQSAENLRVMGRDKTPPIGLTQYCTDMGLKYEYVQQICINLQGKGLLQPGAETLITANPTHFLPTGYMDTLIDFLKE